MVLLSVVIVGSLTGITLGLIEHFENDVPSVQKLLDQAMQLIDQARGGFRNSLPVICRSTPSR